jgi:hypothetical protein
VFTIARRVQTVHHQMLTDIYNMCGCCVQPIRKFVGFDLDVLNEKLGEI